MVMSRATQCVHDSASTPLGALILDTALAIEECSARADEGETSILLTRGGAIGPILSDERVHSELGGVQSAVEVHFDGFEIGRLRRVLRT